ncbi:class B sortase [Subdoligranulum variabile]|uniref:Sortase, SrtB family n=1 Tax=Subdoligranulum variabile DSM 15176 TaxID=411471 RepID=D1PRQ6_9FIRM|nr:class B sortase [Subdoligranulum variabile]EFB74597.1 sortase, SrtB family [Subdoligranulum variabile DSM 15176]UWP69654.1 class B sortase [Subdoligranulum variabile]
MKTLRRIAILFFGVVFAISLFMLARILVQGRQEQAAFDRLSAALEQPESADGQNPEQSPYEALKEQNPDFFGWISIEGTNIDYPVMFTPDAPEHYLRRAFDGSSSQSGVPFLSADCFAGGGNWLIYGHNMKNGSMFADLLNYARKDFWQAHPLIQFDTLEEEGTYEVFAAFYVRVYTEGESGFAYYEYTDISQQADFEEYLAQVSGAALYDTGVEAQYGDQLITLSTCTNRSQDERFVLVGRQIQHQDS